MQVFACYDEPAPADFESCVDGEWIELVFGFLPPLTIEDGTTLGAAVITLWAFAWAFKKLQTAF
jgi:hypothetical protein